MQQDSYMPKLVQKHLADDFGNAISQVPVDQIEIFDDSLSDFFDESAAHVVFLFVSAWWKDRSMGLQIVFVCRVEKAQFGFHHLLDQELGFCLASENVFETMQHVLVN